VAGVSPDIKWPNDLLAPDGGAKLAGILAVHTAGAVVVGMGVNVHGAPPEGACLDDLAGRRVERAGLLGSWLLALETLLDDWDAVAARYRRECATLGRRVTVEMADGEKLTGLAESVDEQGLLVFRQDGGPVHRLAVGDVTHLR
jgi:BirA family biotin operon repressor/biotin-[acetyl-CoA-carboxylase] ligase